MGFFCLRCQIWRGDRRLRAQISDFIGNTLFSRLQHGSVILHGGGLLLVTDRVGVSSRLLVGWGSQVNLGGNRSLNLRTDH